MSPQQQLWIVAALATVGLAVGSLLASGTFSGNNEKTDTGTAPPPAPKVTELDVPAKPNLVAAGGGSVWVASTHDRNGARLDPGRGKAGAFTLIGRPLDVAATSGAALFTVPEAGGVERASRSGSGASLSPLKTPGVPPFGVTAGEGALWATSEERIHRISLDGAVGPPVELPGFATALAAGEGSVWVATDDRGLLQLDPGDLRPKRRIELEGITALAVGAGAVWAITEAGDVIRVDPPTGKPARAAEPIEGALDIAVGEGYVWVVSADETVTRLDPGTAQAVGDPIEVPAEAGAISVGEGAAWVASESGVVTRIEAGRSA
jgi:hypothetical protein